MEIKYSFNHCAYPGWAEGQKITIFLKNIFSLDDLYEVLRHEGLHAAITKVSRGRTNAKQDHVAIQRMGFS